ncbi:fibrinogen-like coiled coil protein [Sesbania bispinosa]|nr:fibrinogen-like coiled coil protein [Sesbania bispinosa]
MLKQNEVGIGLTLHLSSDHTLLVIMSQVKMEQEQHVGDENLAPSLDEKLNRMQMQKQRVKLKQLERLETTVDRLVCSMEEMKDSIKVHPDSIHGMVDYMDDFQRTQLLMLKKLVQLEHLMTMLNQNVQFSPNDANLSQIDRVKLSGYEDNTMCNKPETHFFNHNVTTQKEPMYSDDDNDKMAHAVDLSDDDVDKILGVEKDNHKGRAPNEPINRKVFTPTGTSFAQTERDKLYGKV